jgi:RNA polymerase sigma-70 factor (ECF subfamily)
MIILTILKTVTMKTQPNFEKDNFNLLFKENYSFLCLISLSIVKDENVSKDVVQDFFVSYWQRRNAISITISFRAYAVKAVKNLSLLAIKKVEKERALIKDLDIEVYDVQRFIEEPKRQGKIFEALNKLPLKRREIFIAAILNDHSYDEIAESKEISVNTVKTQIKRSYAFLRSYLKEDLVIVAGFILSA